MKFMDFSAIDAETHRKIKINVQQFVKRNNITRNISLSRLDRITEEMLRDMNRGNEDAEPVLSSNSSGGGRQHCGCRQNQEGLNNDDGDRRNRNYRGNRNQSQGDSDPQRTSRDIIDPRDQQIRNLTRLLLIQELIGGDIL